ncbi:MAG: acetolactate synthase [Alteromonadaceae bacterium]|nr:MAG: acetolactate synthase [Alteromonadaceae bacterium]
MDIHPLHKYPQDALDKLLSAIPFYRVVKENDPYQFDILMSHSSIIEYRPGELVLERGQVDHWLYFLVKGQLEVRASEGAEPNTILNYITPGELFGDLSMLVNCERTANVVADANCRKVVVFGTDFTIFGKLSDEQPITLETKLIYFRNMVHNLRWKLEVYRGLFPEQSFASEHRKVKLYSGLKDTFSELESLDEQAKQLAHLLIHWNHEFARQAQSPIGRDMLAAYG